MTETNPSNDRPDTSQESARLDPISEAIAAFAAGQPIVVVDDEDRENEGDLIMAAEFAQAATMGFFVRYTSGVICAPMGAERAAAFELPPMVSANEDPKGTAYTISCDAVGVTTGISAAERAQTGRHLATADPDPASITRPGHVFPLIAKAGGVRERPGHTEAGVEFARLAGATPVAMIGEVVHDDGSMMRFDSLRDFADAHELVMVSIEELIDYLNEADRRSDEESVHVDDGEATTPRSTNESVTSPRTIDASAEVPLPTKHGSFTARAFTIDGHDHLGVFSGVSSAAVDEASAGEESSLRGPAPLVRVHSECLTGDVFGSHRCDCGEQLDLAMHRISDEGGTVIYLTGHEGRGIGLSNKLRAYALQDRGLDTVDANRELGFHDDDRDYRAAAEILRSIGLSRIRLLTNNPDKTRALESLGITVEAVVPLEIPARPENTNYLATKRERMHHTLTLPSVVGSATASSPITSAPIAEKHHC
ncbi:MAG: 3,4-dihydroxy-2-butanone-4-phosphate synthase [Brevibacterium sp.]|nr:3,4-dihydroxy-2-butanone-4-phosphate synthase [Brevibacterium sp.]MDN6158758.1 3,4-dihydroxy-2-butanone-4-phosphate synthase [Brevibacterium sp.]MDN6176704.1 3,4-dihydroxy-2-butanone-4-phosphate synthase [Brevibacterium sp.]MDN6188681.1 3,4-dihydroxy-2-butanone-4-phosphate synthase [Brevibacterium sp.]MDN6191885.1 3,4-dihydroxy-2-butanone-4-phosphate synthase [Brevibacterium sp.]